LGYVGSGASDRAGYLHDPLYKSGAIVRHAGMLVKLDAPPGIAPGTFALQATRFTSSVRGMGMPFVARDSGLGWLVGPFFAKATKGILRSPS